MNLKTFVSGTMQLQASREMKKSTTRLQVCIAVLMWCSTRANQPYLGAHSTVGTRQRYQLQGWHRCHRLHCLCISLLGVPFHLLYFQKEMFSALKLQSHLGLAVRVFSHFVSSLSSYLQYYIYIYIYIFGDPGVYRPGFQTESRDILRLCPKIKFCLVCTGSLLC